MINVRDLGLQDFEKTWALQRELLQQRAEDRIPDQLIVVQHPEVYTTGRAFQPEHLLSTATAPVIPIERGGSITFHEPGQWVFYPIFKLEQERRDIRRFLTGLEQVMIDTLTDFGYPATRDARNTGVWIAEKKVVAIGIAIRRWVTWHGMALNVSNRLELTRHIAPCGFDAQWVTSLAQESGPQRPLPEVNALKNSCIEHLKKWWEG